MKMTLIKINFLTVLSFTQFVNAGQIPAALIPSEPPPQMSKAGLSPNTNLANSPVNDEYFGYQWGLLNGGQSYTPKTGELLFDMPLFSNPLIQIGWKNFDLQMKRDVIVAVMDSGMYTTNGGHSELKDALLPGKNFVEVTSKNYDDKIGHGTHIAGIMAAKINNNEGITGLSNKIKILPLKVYGERESSAAPAKSDTKPPETPEESKNSFTNKITPRLIQAIDYAISQKVDVIQLSLGWPRLEENSEIRAAFKKADDAGIIVVAASGNDGHNAQIYPCAYPEVLCVGAIALDGRLADFSNRGSHVDFLAPGLGILSTIPPTIESNFFGPRGYDIKNGTSQAAPFVSAAAAILRGVYPQETSEQIKNRLRLGASPISKEVTFGLINIERSLGLQSTDIAMAYTKSLEDALVDIHSLEFSFPLTVFSNLTKPTQVSVKSLSANIQITSVQKISSQKNETQYLVKGKAASLEADNDFKYEIQVNERVQNANLLLKVSLADLSPSSMEIKTMEPVKNIGFLPVTSLLPSARSQFWSFKTNKENGTMSLYLWKHDGDRLIEKSTVVPDAETPLQAFNLLTDDFDFDGREDYLLVTTKNFNSKTEPYSAAYIYLDENFNISRRFEIDVEKLAPFYLSIKTMPLVKIKLPDGSFLKTPLFTNKGAAPKMDSMKRFDSDQERALALKKPVSTEDFIAARGLPVTEINPIIQRVFYYEPATKGQSQKMILRTLTGHISEAAIYRLIFEQTVKKIFQSHARISTLVSKKELKAALDSDQLPFLISQKSLSSFFSPDESEKVFNTGVQKDLRYIGMFPQTNEEASLGHFSMLISLGRGINVQYYQLSFTDLTSRFENVQITELMIPSIDLNRNSMDDATSLQGGKINSEVSLKAIYTFNSARSLILRNGKVGGFKIEMSDPKEAIVSILKTFTKGADMINFVETNKFMRVQGQWNGKQVDEKARIYRSSFLPGKEFSQLFEPVIISTEQLPGVSIDSSDIFSNSLVIYGLDEDGKMRSSIEKSIDIPKNCKLRRKPLLTELNGKNFSRFAVLCVDEVEKATKDSPAQLKFNLHFLDLK